MRERTLLFGLPLRAESSPYVESFRSYLQRLAYAHNLKPRALLEALLDRFAWDGPMFDLAFLLKFWDVHGSGSVGAGIRSRIEQATSTALFGSWFSSISELVAGQHLTVLGAGRYCPVCVREGDAHGHLLWEVACVHVCPIHKVHLREAAICEAPEAQRLKINARPKLPHVCSTCGSIGFKCITQLPEPASSSELWVAEQVGRLLEQPPGRTSGWSALKLRQGLRELVDAVYRGGLVVASKSAGLSRASVCTWISGSFRPNFAGLMQLCHHAQADVVELFGGRFARCADYVEAAKPKPVEGTPDPVRSHIDLTPQRTYVRRTFEENPGAVLAEAAKDAAPPTLEQVAKRLKTSGRFLRLKWPLQSAELVAVSQRYRQAQDQLRYDRSVAKYEESAAALKKAGRPVNAAYLQRVSGLPAFTQNVARRRAVYEVIARYKQEQPAESSAPVGASP